MPNQSPTVYRRRLGNKLRSFRKAAHISVDDIARCLDCHEGTVRRMEAGKIGITRRDARQMLDIYGVTGDEREELLALASQSRQRSIWHNWWNAVPQNFYSYLGLESSASSIRAFENSYIPGLLQTESYARAIVDAVGPERSEAERNKFLALRQARIQRLTVTHPPLLCALIDEAVLSRIVGGPAVMAEQINHLMQMARLPNIEIGIIPYSAGAYRGMDGPFVILEFPETDDLDVILTEGIAGSFFLERPTTVQSYKQRFEAIGKHALPPDESLTLLQQKEPKQT
ncbi:MAG: helix-turn-helix domain-containing protein [Pseudonocardiales bacterium]|nr:helix-turn-helix domain-containing protein [Pseudonocardiales bacterium]